MAAKKTPPAKTTIGEQLTETRQALLNVVVAEFGTLKAARKWAEQNKSGTYWHRAIKALEGE